MQRGDLIYEDRAGYDFWFTGILAGLVIFELALGIWVSFQDRAGAVIFLIIGILLVALFYSIMPRKFQIYSDKLVIVLGGPFSWSIPLTTIQQARIYPGAGAMAYRGLRFVTSTKFVVEIIRNQGRNTVISPSHGELFLEQLNQTIKLNSSRGSF